MAELRKKAGYIFVVLNVAIAARGEWTKASCATSTYSISLPSALLVYLKSELCNPIFLFRWSFALFLRCKARLFTKSTYLWINGPISSEHFCSSQQFSVFRKIERKTLLSTDEKKKSWNCKIMRISGIMKTRELSAKKPRPNCEVYAKSNWVLQSITRFQST